MLSRDFWLHKNHLSLGMGNDQPLWISAASLYFLQHYCIGNIGQMSYYN